MKLVSGGMHPYGYYRPNRVTFTDGDFIALRAVVSFDHSHLTYDVDMFWTDHEMVTEELEKVWTGVHTLSVAQQRLTLLGLEMDCDRQNGNTQKFLRQIGVMP